MSDWRKTPSGLFVPSAAEPEPEPKPRGWFVSEGPALWRVKMLATGDIVDVPVEEAQRLIAAGDATADLGLKVVFDG